MFLTLADDASRTHVRAAISSGTDRDRIVLHARYGPTTLDLSPLRANEPTTRPGYHLVYPLRRGLLAHITTAGNATSQLELIAIGRNRDVADSLGIFAPWFPTAQRLVDEAAQSSTGLSHAHCEPYDYALACEMACALAKVRARQYGLKPALLEASLFLLDVEVFDLPIE